MMVGMRLLFVGIFFRSVGLSCVRLLGSFWQCARDVGMYPYRYGAVISVSPPATIDARKG